MFLVQILQLPLTSQKIHAGCDILVFSIISVTNILMYTIWRTSHLSLQRTYYSLAFSYQSQCASLLSHSQDNCDSYSLPNQPSSRRTALCQYARSILLLVAYWTASKLGCQWGLFSNCTPHLFCPMIFHLVILYTEQHFTGWTHWMEKGESPLLSHVYLKPH